MNWAVVLLMWLTGLVVLSWAVTKLCNTFKVVRELREKQRRAWELEVLECLRDLASRFPRPGSHQPSNYEIDGKLYSALEAEAVWAAKSKHPWSDQLLDKYEWRDGFREHLRTIQARTEAAVVAGKESASGAG